MKMTKRILSLGLAAILVASMSVAALAANGARKVPQTSARIIDGVVVTMVENMTYEEWSEYTRENNARIESTRGGHTHILKTRSVGFQQYCFNGSGYTHSLMVKSKYCTVSSCAYEKAINKSVQACPSTPKCSL